MIQFFSDTFVKPLSYVESWSLQVILFKYYRIEQLYPVFFKCDTSWPVNGCFPITIFSWQTSKNQHSLSISKDLWLYRKTKNALPFLCVWIKEPENLMHSSIKTARELVRKSRDWEQTRCKVNSPVALCLCAY